MFTSAPSRLQPGRHPGVKLTGVSPVGPAAKAGVRGGDIIVALGGKGVLNIYDYTAILGELKVGQETEIIVKRGEKVTLKLARLREISEWPISSRHLPELLRGIRSRRAPA